MLDSLTALGYTVDVAHSQENPDVPTVYRVEHPDLGLSIMVAEDDEDTLANLADEDLHAARLEVAQRNADGERVTLDEDGQVIELRDQG